MYDVFKGISLYRHFAWQNYKQNPISVWNMSPVTISHVIYTMPNSSKYT